MVFLGVVPMALIAIFQEQLKRWFFAPNIVIDFRLKAPFCSKTPFYAFFDKKKVVDTEAYYFRVKVINKGKTSAKLCEVVMTELLVEAENGWREVDFFQQVNLKWDTGKTKDAHITLNPSPVVMLCDIGYISEQFESNLFHMEYLYTIGGYQPTVLGRETKYRFTIGVISENARFVPKTFEFYWTGVWKDNSSEMFKEINIKPVS